MDLTEPRELTPYDPELPFSVEYLRKPIRDHGIPAKRAHMIEILGCIQDALESGRCVYVHCRAGIGRTGMVIGCLLVERGLQGEAALDELNRLWQQSERSQNWGSVPETDQQVDFVRTWKPQLGLGASGVAPGERGKVFPNALPAVDPSDDDEESDASFPFAGLLVSDEARSGVPAQDAHVGRTRRADPAPRGAPAAAPRAGDQRGATPGGGAPAHGVRSDGVPVRDEPVSGGRGRRARVGDETPPGVPTADPRTADQRGAIPVGGTPAEGVLAGGVPARDAPAPRRGLPASDALVEDRLLDPEVLSAAGTLRDRFLGALLGLAVGDAVAAATQYRRPGTFTPVGDMLGGGPFDLPRGAWSDDTSMVLCLADSLLERNGFDARDQMERYRRWQQEGFLAATGQCVGITASTARAIAMAQWRRQAFSGSHDPSQVDPEPLSRVAAPVLFFFASGGQAVDQATEAARTTCQAPAVLDACRSLASALHAALSGQPKAVVLELVAIAATGGRGAPAVLTAAAAAFGATANFRDAILYAANLGGDSDVVAAVCGQLAGAYYSVKAIPTSWHNGLMQKELIASYADRLLAHAMLGLSG
jgi:ADP-ribosyl-[dinitrogen reductase] hydrolase